MKNFLNSQWVAVNDNMLELNLCIQSDHWDLPHKRIFLQCRWPRFDPSVAKIPWDKGKATHFSILAWRVPWVTQRQTQPSNSHTLTRQVSCDGSVSESIIMIGFHQDVLNAISNSFAIPDLNRQREMKWHCHFHLENTSPRSKIH